MSKLHQTYLDLLRSFVSGQLSAPAFSTAFFNHYRQDEGYYGPQIGLLLDELMAMADAYCEDPALRGPEDIDEDQFLGEAQGLLPRLEQA
jgi:hypothetical protein